MKTRKLITCILTLSFSLVAHNALAETSVWKVSKGGNYFYLGGTIHVLSENDHPLPKEFFKAYKDASTVYFETDLVAANTPEFQAKSIAAMTYSGNRNLASELKPSTYRRLASFMASRQLPIDNFSKFKPWGVSLIITILEYQRLGMVEAHGVDAYFNNLAISENKKIKALETPDEQLGFLMSMEKIDPSEGIDYTLSDLERLPNFIQTMKKGWRSGDIEAFSKNPSVIQMRNDFPEMYHTLIVNRNNTWMRKIPAFIDDSDIEFLLVGALHLNGKEGLLHQLRTQGFKVEQL